MTASLAPRDVAYLTARGISVGHASRYGLRTATAEEINALFGRSDLTSGGLLFPYPVRNGELPLLRVRLHSPILHASEPTKPQRYIQPKNSTIRPFITHSAMAARAAETPLVITEGECKALAAEEASAAAIGLPGCWGWAQPRARAAGGYTRPTGPLRVHPDLDAFTWTRAVYLAPDSDIRTNPHVEDAFLRFADELRVRGARLRMTLLPPHVDGSKQGLDDLLAREGVEAAKWHAQHAPIARRDAMAAELIRRRDHFVHTVAHAQSLFDATIVDINASARDALRAVRESV